MCLNCQDEATQLQDTSSKGGLEFAPAPLQPKALDDPSVIHEPIQFTNEGVAIDGYLARPANHTPARAIIVTHGNAGLPEDMCNAAAQVAQAGFVGLLLSPTSRYPDLTQLSRDFLMSYGYIKLLLSDIRAAITYLHQQPFVEPGDVGLLGFCGGGILNILFAATHAGVRAVVAFYAAPRVMPGQNSATDPRPDMIDFIPQFTVPLQWHCGTEDVVIPAQDIQEFQDVLRRQQVPAEVYLYEGAQHGFYHYTDVQDYDPVASALAHQRMQQFFNSYLR